MAAENLQVVAVIETTEEHLPKVKEALSYCALESKREEGCVSYEIYTDSKNPAKFVVLETWANDDALEAHAAKGHFLKLKELLSLLKAKVEIITLEPLDS